MIVRTLCVLLSFLCAGLPCLWADLTFEETSVFRKLSPSDETVAVSFAFKNTGDSAVVIQNVDSNCGCLSAVTDKQRYAPGEAGRVDAEFKIGSVVGTVTKYVWVVYDDEKEPATGEKAAESGDSGDEEGNRDPRRVTLSVQLDIPAIMEIEPNPVKWAVGGKPEPKVMKLTVTHDKPIHVKEVRTSRENVSVEVKTIEKGKVYELVLTPKSLDKVQLGMVIIETDCDVEKHAKKLGYFSIVRNP